ncbi:MAG: hypothetical protein J7F05_09080 [Trichodesmium erythraeum GBRTRLIN201]|nr:hypothetical protein [Trichodesmium erythraeum GBRTRLIN201]
MLAGHFSTALVAHQKFPKGTLLYFLIASQLQDLLWFTFHYLGLEPTGPSDVFNATLRDMTVDMLYSHDLIPQLIWVFIIFLIGKILFKNTKVGLVGAALVVGHFVLDFFSGHPHHIFGEETHQVGLGLYATNVFLAIAVEAIFSIAVLWYFFQQEAHNGIKRTSKNKAAIIGLFAFGIVFMLTIATTSFRDLFGIPEFNLSFNSNVPTLILTYAGMILYLNHYVSKFEVSKKNI